MTSTTKKKRERFYFERARSKVSEFRPGQIDDTSENPDLIVQSSPRLYGVEVTEVVRSATKAVLETKRIICERAQKQYLATTGVAGLRASVIFHAHTTPTKRDQDGAAEELFTLVARHFPRVPSSIERRTLREGDDFTSKWFSSVWLHFHPQVPRSRWQAIQAWGVPRLLGKELQEVIARKEPRVAQYRHRTREVWLLIVVNGFDAATALSVDVDALSRTYATRFDGVVLFDDAMDRATVLHTESPL